MAEIESNPRLELVLVVTGSHLAAEFGGTASEIIEDGFRIDESVPILSAEDGPLAVARATGAATIGIAEALERLHPDFVLVLGDRSEILGAAQAALLLGIPVAHIGGGEITEGAVDDSIRHAITKMSHLHFTAAEEYRQRVIQLGESPDRVHNVGAVGLDNLNLLDLLSESALADSLRVPLSHPLALCTFHPETLADQTPEEALTPLFEALKAHSDLQVVFTKANADAGGRAINRLLEEFVGTHSERMSVFASLGQVRYLSLMSVADLVIGNSSSGILEAPSAGTPTVNIGDRQKGRLRAPSVIDAPNSSGAIGAAIDEALSSASRTRAAQRRSPYGSPGAARAIVAVLDSTDPATLRTKRFQSLTKEQP